MLSSHNGKKKSEVVVVTGASAGVGRAIACEFAEHGVPVALLARSLDGLEGAQKDAERLGGRASPFRRMSSTTSKWNRPQRWSRENWTRSTCGSTTRRCPYCLRP